MGQKSGYTSVGKNALEKAHKFTALVEHHDWQCKTTFDEGTGVTHLFARRGTDEIIDIWWQANGGIGKEAVPLYKLAGETIKLNNVSAAVSIATKAPDTSRLGKAIKRRKKRITGKNVALVQPPISPVGDDERPTLPALPGEAEQGAYATLSADTIASDGAVKAALADRRIEWLNTQSGNIETAIVDKICKIVRNGHDYIEFTDKSGFHAVYLDQIVSAV